MYDRMMVPFCMHEQDVMIMRVMPSLMSPLQCPM